MSCDSLQVLLANWLVHMLHLIVLSNSILNHFFSIDSSVHDQIAFLFSFSRFLFNFSNNRWLMFVNVQLETWFWFQQMSILILYNLKLNIDLSLNRHDQIWWWWFDSCQESSWLKSNLRSILFIWCALTLWSQNQCSWELRTEIEIRWVKKSILVDGLISKICWSMVCFGINGFAIWSIWAHDLVHMRIVFTVEWLQVDVKWEAVWVYFR